MCNRFAHLDRFSLLRFRRDQDTMLVMDTIAPQLNLVTACSSCAPRVWSGSMCAARSSICIGSSNNPRISTSRSCISRPLRDPTNPNIPNPKPQAQRSRRWADGRWGEGKLHPQVAFWLLMWVLSEDSSEFAPRNCFWPFQFPCWYFYSFETVFDFSIMI